MILALAVTGCGQSSTVSRSSLAKRAAAVQSLAAEGALLAGDVADGRSTTVFQREHSSELSKSAGKAASSLASAKTTPALEPDLRRLRILATRAESQLRRLGHASEHDARGLEHGLQSVADSSEKLGDTLG